MRGDDGDTVSVDLVEVDSPDALLPHGPAGPDDGTSLPPDDVPAAVAGHRRRRRVLLAATVGVVLALAAGGGVLAVLDARRAEARWDALEERGWPLVDLGSPLEEAWRLETGGWPMVVTSDVIVLQTWSQTLAGATWRAVDVETGAVLWEHRDPGDGWCTSWNPRWSEIAASAPLGLVLGASVLGTLPDPTLLVCAGASFGGELPAPDTTSRLLVLDLADGREVATIEVPGALITFEPTQDDVVVATVTADGTIDLTRAGLLDGGVRWAVETEAQALDDEGGYVGAWPQVRDGVVTLVAADGAVSGAFDLGTGASAPPPPDEPTTNGGWILLPDGSRVDMTYSGMPVSGTDTYVLGPSTVVVTGPDGEERFTAEGELWVPWVSDGSMADRIIVTRSGDGGRAELVALDVVTGEELWTSPASWASTVLQVDGVVVAGSGYLSGTDLRTGEVLWEHRGASQGAMSAVTDGTRFLVPVGEGGTTALVAIDIRSGVDAWSVPTVDGVQTLNVVDGGVLVANDATLILYR